MKISSIRKLFAASWRLCLVYGIPVILFWAIGLHGFVTGKIWLAVLASTLAALTTILWYYFVREVDKKEKELTEKDRQKYPIETAERPTRSADTKGALKEIFKDLKAPLQLKTPKSKDSTEENQKG